MIWCIKSQYFSVIYWQARQPRVHKVVGTSVSSMKPYISNVPSDWSRRTASANQRHALSAWSPTGNVHVGFGEKQQQRERLLRKIDNQWNMSPCELMFEKLTSINNGLSIFLSRKHWFRDTIVREAVGQVPVAVLMNRSLWFRWEHQIRGIQRVHHDGCF